MIRDANPQWILLVGIAGAYPVEEYSLGDVLLASRVYDFTVTAAVEGQTVEQNPRGGGVHPQVSELLQIIPSEACQKKLGEWNSASAISMQKPAVKIPGKLNASAYYGTRESKRKVKTALKANFPDNGPARAPLCRIVPVATGNTLVKDTELAAEWKKPARSIGHIEMELGGVYVAAQPVHKPVLSIRGISDVVGFRRSSDWIQYACHTAAAFMRALIASGFIAPKKP